MSGRAHLVIILAAVLTIAFIIRLVRKHHLRTKYSLLWIMIAVAIGFLVAFPNLLDRTSRALGIYYPPAFLLLVAVSFLFLVVVQFSWELSRSDERLRRLAEEHALLRAELDQLRRRFDGDTAGDVATQEGADAAAVSSDTSSDPSSATSAPAPPSPSPGPASESLPGD